MGLTTALHLDDLDLAQMRQISYLGLMEADTLTTELLFEYTILKLFLYEIHQASLYCNLILYLDLCQCFLNQINLRRGTNVTVFKYILQRICLFKCISPSSNGNGLY